jgi:hypothetical protein
MSDFIQKINPQAGIAQITGTGSPEGVVIGYVGQWYLDTAINSTYRKDSGDNTNTGWALKAAGGSTPVIDNLTSTSTTSALSANQGNVLDGKITDVTDNITAFSNQNWRMEITSGSPTYPGAVTATEFTSTDQLYLCQGNAETSGIGLNGDYAVLWNPMDGNASLRVYDEDSANAGYYFNTAGSAVTFSDINLKENINKYSYNILKNIAKINVYNFEWKAYNVIIQTTQSELSILQNAGADKDAIIAKYLAEKRINDIAEVDKLIEYLQRKLKRCEDKTKGFGFIAQELQQAFPNAVKADKEGFLQVDWQNISIYTVEALKQLYVKLGTKDPSILDDENVVKFTFNIDSGNYFSFSQIDEQQIIVDISDITLSFFEKKISDLQANNVSSFKYYYNIEEKYYIELKEISIVEQIIAGLKQTGDVIINDISINDYNLKVAKLARLDELNTDYNTAQKITIQNGKTLEIAHDTPERGYFLKLIEDVSNLSTTEGAAFIYEQQIDSGKLALRILPEIATYIFKDLFVVTLNNPQQTKVNSRVHNKTTVYELALEQINDATTQAELDSITWTFLNPAGIAIDVNAKAAEMLADPTVSDFAKAAINAAKDPTTGEIHLVKTLPELAADS